MPVAPADRVSAATLDPRLATSWVWERGDFRRLEALEPPPLCQGVALALCTLARPESVRRFLQSVGNQGRRPNEVVVVDAGADALTEDAVREFAGTGICPRVTYARVTPVLRGLTRQRNLALGLVEHDLVAFFDDDVTLEPKCLGELERVLRNGGEGIVGAGGIIETPGRSGLAPIWRLRRLLGVVSTLQPGRYCRSGMSTPWSLAEGHPDVLEGDWLPGFAMMWKTGLARELKFHEPFRGYAQGEDLEFSLRAGSRGKLLMACGARVRDEKAMGGRPNAFQLGYMAIANRYAIQRSALADRTWKDGALFAYAWSVDTVLLLRHLAYPRRWRATLLQVAGRADAAWDIVRGR